MKRTHALVSAAFAALGMFVLILDAKTALAGAQEGLHLCLQTVVPVLFPFFVFSALLTGNAGLLPIRLPPWLSSILRIPKGAEVLWITGLLGGYPVGAKCVAEACHNGRIDRPTAQRMLGFCSNAGPSFIFGMASVSFPSAVYCWLLFGVQILSSFIAGLFLTGKSLQVYHSSASAPVDWNRAVNSSIQSLASVCGWIVEFRVILAVLERWVIWLIPRQTAAILTGFLELTNGILSLQSISSVPLRFIVCSAMLNFGGLCVAMQTAAVAGSLGLAAYLRGKVLQTLLSISLAATLCIPQTPGYIPISVISLFAVFVFTYRIREKNKKTVAIPA